MADRVVVMRSGHIEQAADPITLYERPANRFVANFIGSPAMNFFDARIEGGAVHWVASACCSPPTKRAVWVNAPLSSSASGPNTCATPRTKRA